MGGVSIEPPRQQSTGTPPEHWAVPPAEPAPRRRPWLVAVVAGWAVLLFVLAYISFRTDEPTVREQRGMAEAVPLVSQVVGELVAAGGDETVAQLTPGSYQTGCRITPIRSGATLKRGVIFRAPEADAPALLDQIADRLPPAYLAGTRHSEGGTVHALRADAGEFVGITGGVTGPGVITLTVTTGCRPVDIDYDPTARVVYQLAVDEGPGRLLRGLGVTEPGPAERESAPCPGGGWVHTVRAAGPGTLDTALADALARWRPVGAIVVTDTPDRYAYRSGSTGVEVRTQDGEIRATVTTGC